MGVCMPHNFHQKPYILPSTPTSKTLNFSDLRELIITNILRLHKLSLKNEKALQENLINNNETSALICKYRETVAKSALDSLRELLSLTDSLTETLASKEEKKELLRQGNLILANVNCGVLSGEFENWFEEGKDVKKMMTERFGVDHKMLKELQASVEEEKKKLKNAQIGEYVRLKYLRSM